MSHRRHHLYRALRTLVTCFAVVGLLGCPAPDETAEELGEPQEDIAGEVPTGPEGPSVEEGEEVMEEASGSFTLTLTGDVAESFEGTAVCTIDNITQELEVVMTPGRESPYRFSVAIPEFTRTDKYTGTLEVIGAERSLGRAEVAATRVAGRDVVKEPGVILAFRGSYQGEAGDGRAEGEVRCNVPDGIDGELSLPEAGEAAGEGS